MAKKISRKKKLIYNITASITFLLIGIICSLILPYYLLNYYGSEINGLVASISQFLGFISLAQAGVGAVVQSNLYKPLADNDNKQISRIFISAEQFFRKIALVLFVYVVLLMIFYPLSVDNSFDYFFVASLIFIIAMRVFINYFFNISYSLILKADGKEYIVNLLRTVVLLVTVVLSVLMIQSGYDVRWVKIIDIVVFGLQPLVLHYYVRKNYHLNKDEVLTEEPIKQKWNGFAQHLAAIVLTNTDVIVLTLFANLKLVSVYMVYNLVIRGLKSIIFSTSAGISPVFGNMYAKGETDLLKRAFDLVEWAIHFFVTFLFTAAAILIIPFISIYTAGIDDVEYQLPVFAILFILANVSHSIRLPYTTIILAIGHYKQTQTSAIIEMLINILISVIMVFNYGLIGVAIGTLAAMTYRTLYLVRYLSKNVLYRKVKYFVKNILVDILAIALIIIATLWVDLAVDSYGQWIIAAVQVAVSAFLVLLIVNIVFYKQNMLKVYSVIKCKIKSRG